MTDTDKILQAIGAINQRLDNQDKRFDSQDKKLDNLTKDVQEVKQVQAQTNTRLDRIEQSQAQTNEILTHQSTAINALAEGQKDIRERTATKQDLEAS